MTYNTLTFEVADNVATITLSRCRSACPFADGNEAELTAAALMSSTDVFRQRVEAIDEGE